MKDGKGTFDVLASIEKHIESLKPMLPKQVLVCIGEYPIKTLLKNPSINKEGTLPILIEKSSDEIYKWLPKGYEANFVLGFEDAHIDTHFWYNVLPTVSKDNSVIESLKKKSTEKLRTAIIFSSIWDGIGSAALPTLIEKFKAVNMDSLSIAVLPSKIQPADAHFNAYAALKTCSVIDGATVLLMERDQIESYEGVDRKGELIKGNMVANYLLNLFLAKDSLVEEISELSRTFNIKLFSPIVVAGASYRIYGSIENMLNTALLKPFLTFDLSNASLLYVLLCMSSTLKDKLPRGKIELAITNWFKEKTTLQSIYITEPVYTEDMTDRIDAVLFVGGFDTSVLFGDLEKKVEPLKNRAVERGLMTADWRVEFKIEEPPKPDPLKVEEPPTITEAPLLSVEAPKVVAKAPVAKETENTNTLEIASEEVNPAEPPALTVAVPKIVEEPQAPNEPTQAAEKPKTTKPKRTRRTKKLSTNKKEKIEKVDAQKEQTSA